MAKTPIDKLQSSVQKILEEYGDDVKANLDIITAKLSQKGAQAIRNTAKSTFKGKNYAKSWTSKVERERLYSTGIIYSRKAGLPHLLEHGHAKRGGGRVSGREHIKPVEEELVSEFEREVKAKL